jgi:fucose permease
MVNLAGLVQGIVLVTFPAASTIFTSPRYYGLSSSQYGDLFVPQVLAAIAASLLGARLAGRIGTKRVYLLGLVSSLTAMGLLLISAPARADLAVAYPLLLIATALVGCGFGLTVPVLNTYATVFHPGAVDTAVLVLNALLGLGTVLAPVFVALFVGLGIWWGLPLTSAVLLAAVLAVSLRLPLRATAAAQPRRAGRHIPARFWLYAAFITLYGICETMSGNWSQLEMTRQLGASATQAALALAAFWGMVTAGRILSGAVDRWLPPRVLYRVLPLVLAAAFVVVSQLSHGAVAAGIAAFALAGLGCSALLPLTISLGEARLTAMPGAVAGGIIAFYQFGYGIAAFGVGPLQSAGLSLSAIFGGSAVVAAVLAILASLVAGGRRR